MNKKFIVMAAFAAFGLAFTACSNNDEIDGGGGGDTPIVKELAIGYNINLEKSGSTRGAETTLATLEQDGNTFMVWGHYATDATNPGALYVGTSSTVGTIIEYDGTATAWDYQTAADKKMWPAADQKLNFQAVTPYDAGTVFNSPAVADEDAVSAVGMTYTAPTAVASQKDVLFGHAESMTYATSASDVPIAFEHALSQIAFTGKVNAEGIVATIKSVKVHNAKTTADIGYIGTVTGQHRALGVTTGKKDGTDYTAVDDYAIKTVSGADVVLSSTTAAPLSDTTDGMLMMVPQSGATAWQTTATPKTTAAADIDGETYLEVECKITNNGTYVLGSASAYGKVYIPFTIAWSPKTKYTYLLNFGTGSGGYDADGNPMMSYITFSLAAFEAWTDGGSTEYKF